MLSSRVLLSRAASMEVEEGELMYLELQVGMRMREKRSLLGNGSTAGSNILHTEGVRM